MDQDQQQPADPKQVENPFKSPPITLVDDRQPPVRPYTSQTSAEAMLALVLAILGIPGAVFCCFGVVTVWMELGALMLAVAAKKKIRDNPYVGGNGLATAAICVALVVLTLYAVGYIMMFIMTEVGKRF